VTALRFEERAVLQTTGAVLRNLAGAAGHHILAALAASLRVVGRPEPVGNGFGLLEDEAVVVEGPQWNDGVLVDLVERRALDVEAVGPVVEAGRGFGDALDVQRRGPLGPFMLPSCVKRWRRA
jgi:hypothetical protein